MSKKKKDKLGQTANKKEQNGNKKNLEAQTEHERILKVLKEQHIILWFLFFFPIGLYKSFKYKFLPKWMNIALTIVFIFLVVVIGDAIINPERVINTEVEQDLTKGGDWGDLGTLISVEYYTSIDDYYICDLITSQSRYDVYLDDSFDIKAIKEVEGYLEDIYIADDFNETYVGVLSEIIKFVNNNDVGISNNIEGYEDVCLGEQILTINGVEYDFNVEFEDVESIYSNDELVYEREGYACLRLNNEMFSKVCKNFPEVDDISYITTILFFDDYYKIYVNTTNGNIYELVVYSSGRITVNKATGSLEEIVENETIEETSLIEDSE